MPAQTAALALPFVNWMLLLALASGWFAFIALLAEMTDATRGFLRFSAVCAALVAGLAVVADLALPAPTSQLAIEAAPPDMRTLARAALVALVVVGFLYGAMVGRPGARRWLGIAGLAALGVVLTAAAFGWARTAADGIPLLIQMLMLSGVTGGGVAALVLGHWYLVTPRISTRPLLTLTKALGLLVGLQLLLFATWALFGGGPGQLAFDSLFGSAALYGWLRLVVSLAFPLILVAMAWRTAQTRSMESATGLLYIAFAAIAAGTIGAAMLYVTRGILV